MKTFKELKQNLKKDISNLDKIKVAVVGDTATQFLATAIKGYGIEIGYDINLFEAEYNQIERQFMDPTSDLYQFDADYIVVFQSSHKWNEHYALLNSEQQSTLATDRLDFVNLICQLTKARIIYMNYPEIDESIFGSYANKVKTSFVYQLRKFNYELMNLSQQNQNLYICDISSLYAKYGRDFMFDPAIYTSTEMILSVDGVPLVAKRIIDIVCFMV